MSAKEVVAQSVGGAARTTLVGLIGRAAGLLTTIVVTHFVSKAEYGNANLAMIVVAVLNAATLLTPQQALLTRHDRFEEASALVRFYVGWSGALLALILLGAGRPIVTALGQPEAAPLLYAYLVAMVLERLAVIPALRLNYELRFGDLARLELWANAAYVSVTLGAAVGGLGGWSLALGMVARHGLRVALLGLRYRAEIWPRVPPFGPPERQLAREVLHYAWPVHLGGFGEFLTLYLDNLVVGKLYSAAAQGLYVVGYTLAMTPADTIAMQGATAMVRALGLRDGETRRRTYLQGLRYISLLLFPICVITAVTAPTLEQALLPPRWHGVGAIAAGLCLGAMSRGFMRMSFTHLTAIHRPRAAAVTEAARLLTFALALLLVCFLDKGRAHVAWIGWGVSLAFVVPALGGIALSLRADHISFKGAALALLPPALGALVTLVLLGLVREGLHRAGMRPSVLRLALELGVGLLIYGTYIRLAHGGIYREATAWLRAQRRGAA